MNPLRVLVAGGGIGGLTAAVALRRAGAAVTVHERAPELRMAQAGHGLVLWHNAVLALRDLGLEPGVEKIGYELREHLFRNSGGRRLARWSMARKAAELGAPVYSVSRPDLHALLVEEAGDALRLDSPCGGFSADGSGVTVRVGDAEERVDALIGADGLRSVVRAALVPHEPPPRYAGFTAFQGVIDLPGSGVPEHTFLSTWGRGRWFVCYRLTGDLVYWDGVLSDHITAPFGTRPLDLLAREFGDWPDPIPRLVAATDPADLTTVPIFDRPPMPRWAHGRVALLGDAAHPMTFNLGQGAGQSIEDALVLAECLKGGDVAEGLRRYEARRVARAARIVRRSRANGALTRWRHPVACAARDAFMRLTFDRLVYRKTYQLTMEDTS
ncbi:FAD-dependent monooxygenase [Nonomuraea dietziae]|uniref:2-polyprenyl-6-methoxyphenol hydroxylase-like FAD-dependent oxidoreductase n=1 Tax=Nonomuraea dietziae TaxID=65515 RepID=A0A7W5VC43_9ACTN|nr:FAD-dependent monooxygenase [Nonomuraea dietziae]MBB3728869.1 2-polyprenyl-6-methoxyphenol hydroxylase-like FAD-dependent oxidoreductase [Nonomuraea dietziae]